MYVIVGVYCMCVVVVFFFKQKTAYEMRISDWSSDVCSSDLTKALTSSMAAFFISASRSPATASVAAAGSLLASASTSWPTSMLDTGSAGSGVAGESVSAPSGVVGKGLTGSVGVKAIG